MFDQPQTSMTVESPSHLKIFSTWPLLCKFTEDRRLPNQISVVICISVELTRHTELPDAHPLTRWREDNNGERMGGYYPKMHSLTSGRLLEITWIKIIYSHRL